jgi:DNA-3-methyladenine glycosylase
VLVRALAPLEGIETMRARRGHMRDEQLCSGAGKLTQALGVDLDRNGTSLIDGPVAIRAAEPGSGDLSIAAGPRIGITKAVELHWRFCAADSPHVSYPRPSAERVVRDVPL